MYFISTTDTKYKQQESVMEKTTNKMYQASPQEHSKAVLIVRHPTAAYCFVMLVSSAPNISNDMWGEHFEVAVHCFYPGDKVRCFWISGGADQGETTTAQFSSFWCRIRDYLPAWDPT